LKSKDYTTGGMIGYLQAAAPDRYARVQKYGLELESFTVCAGDEWNPGVPNGDKSKLSERTEFRSKTEDTVGDDKVYSYVIPILIPEDYAEFSPKQTFAQWHEGGYPVASIRYENGKLEFVTNYMSTFNFRNSIPFTKGKIVTVKAGFIWAPGKNAGSALVTADDKYLIADLKGHSLVETGTKTIYAKYGIYRSGMDVYPDQTVMFGRVWRNIDGEIYRPPEPVVTPPIAATPAPLTPTPAAPVPISSVYEAVSIIIAGIRKLEAQVTAISPASVPFLAQAIEKLTKMTDQMQKAEAKKK
jgi:hypothetical protein